MSARVSIVMSDNLAREIEEAGGIEVVMVRALTLYLAVRQGARRGLQLAFFDPKTGDVVETVVGI